ncbi:predicted protein [Nematostella vectensis]|uniref:MCMDC2 N-terminal domain-containing protein n=1 Tax=Nematostella vectensis TaxID=45351 RepID=A7SXG1_NEMVE|nr:predicted protein [Nematostella vectensis]|eukprot:XP_001623709.1 predicted protein [Nematostella vectensis]
MSGERSIQEVVLFWLSESGGLKEIADQCDQFSVNCPEGRTVYRFVLGVDLMELLEFDAQIGNMAIHRPQELVKYFQEGFFNWINKVLEICFKKKEPLRAGFEPVRDFTNKNISLRAGFEPAREDPIGFLVQRLNSSATATLDVRPYFF